MKKILAIATVLLGSLAGNASAQHHYGAAGRQGYGYNPVHSHNFHGTGGYPNYNYYNPYRTPGGGLGYVSPYRGYNYGGVGIYVAPPIRFGYNPFLGYNPYGYNYNGFGYNPYVYSYGSGLW